MVVTEVEVTGGEVEMVLLVTTDVKTKVVSTIVNHRVNNHEKHHVMLNEQWNDGNWIRMLMPNDVESSTVVVLIKIEMLKTNAAMTIATIVVAATTVQMAEGTAWAAATTVSGDETTVWEAETTEWEVEMAAVMIVWVVVVMIVAMEVLMDGGVMTEEVVVVAEGSRIACLRQVAIVVMIVEVLVEVEDAGVMEVVEVAATVAEMVVVVVEEVGDLVAVEVMGQDPKVVHGKRHASVAIGTTEVHHNGMEVTEVSTVVVTDHPCVTIVLTGVAIVVVTEVVIEVPTTIATTVLGVNHVTERGATIGPQ